MVGTASTVRAFLLIEEPGPWGVEALRDARLPDGLGALIQEAARNARVRPLLIRRPTRSTSMAKTGKGRQVFAAHADPNQPWLEAGEVSDLRDVLDLNLAGLGAGTSAGLPRHDKPVFAVCTHGRHDTCCAERGRPVARALAGEYPDHTWEISHVGGDRFAGNLVVLPDGLYFGHVDPASAVRIASTHLAGGLDLEHLRGRSGLPMPAQVAEKQLRDTLDLHERNALTFVGAVGERGATAATFRTLDGRAHVVRVRARAGDAERLTCRSEVDRAPVAYDVVDVVSQA